MANDDVGTSTMDLGSEAVPTRIADRYTLPPC